MAGTRVCEGLSLSAPSLPSRRVTLFSLAEMGKDGFSLFLFGLKFYFLLKKNVCVERECEKEKFVGVFPYIDRVIVLV